MPNQDVWEFAGPEDAKAEIHAATKYLISRSDGNARDGVVQEIIAIVLNVAKGLPREQSNPMDDGLPGG